MNKAPFGIEEWKNAGIGKVQKFRRIASAKHRNGKHKIY
jgi:hypothetical protein